MAAQPPRLPNNLLFSGPPPSLPHIFLLPNNIKRNSTPEIDSSNVALDQTNDDTNDLSEINNIQVPIFERLYNEKHEDVGGISNCALEESIQDQYQPYNLVRRAQSFDISYIYSKNNEIQLDDGAFQDRRSEPDLSKYGLYLEADIVYKPLVPAPIVLNNPFYDGTYALNPSEIDRGTVMLPENYLAFEDSFIPTWECKPEYVVNRELNPGVYFDELPLIPPNDPWSVYGADNEAFGYYTPQFDLPIQEGLQYMRLSDLDFSIPQYKNLPNSEETISTEDVNKIYELTQEPPETYDSNNNDNVIDRPSVSESPISLKKLENVIAPEQNNLNSVENDASNRESIAHSEESINADISYDVTSSLAFMPSSKSSQVPQCSDDTTDGDTSPCSTDYQEASALDIAQSLDELSSDASDFSQSRDDPSPASVDQKSNTTRSLHEVSGQSKNTPQAVDLGQSLANFPLSQLPSIPYVDSLPMKLPPLPYGENLPCIDSNIKLQSNQDLNVSKETVSVCDSNNNSDLFLFKSDQPIPNHVSTVGVKLPMLVNDHPHPPDVPSAWLVKPTEDESVSSVVPVPQISVQNTEGECKVFDKSPKPPSQPTTKESQSNSEPQPSCSYDQNQVPQQTSQLKPEKEVEVS